MISVAIDTREVHRTEPKGVLGSGASARGRGMGHGALSRLESPGGREA